MEMTRQLGVSKIDERNRTYIPEAVTKLLKINGGNNWLSWELDETGQIFVLKGHLRFLRKKNYQPEQKGEMGTSLEGGEENPKKGGSKHGKIQTTMDKTGGGISGKKL